MKQKYTSLRKLVTGAILASALLHALPAFAVIPEDKSSAVVFVYQRVGEDSVPQGNISVDQFREHIDELTKDGYAVLPLAKIIDAVKNGDKLPPKTVAITFEGAYQATLANAIPILEDAQMPYTIFYASDALDGDGVGRMSWDQLKKLHDSKLATLGLLPADYEHMVGLTTEKNAALINRAVARSREMLGEVPLFFAYPYGEYSNALKKQLADYKFKAVFGQQSGVVFKGADFMALPRFTMTDEFGDLDRFMLTANALPLPVSDIVPGDGILGQSNPPRLGFTVSSELTKLDSLSCFASGIGKLPLTRIDNNRIEIRLKDALTDRRTRINCTLPNETITPGEPLSWRWFGLLLTAPALEDYTAADAPDDTSVKDVGGSNDAETTDNNEQN